MNTTSIPVLTIDGTSASGKGSTSSLVAQRLGWNLLDSGSIYRSIAWLIKQKASQQILENNQDMTRLFNKHSFNFQDSKIVCDTQDITQAIRTEEISLFTSEIAKLPTIRQHALELQRSFVKPPGLVADGRDMGTVVFKAAQYKVFLTASTNVRARRRYEQLRANEPQTVYEEVLESLVKRDTLDSQRELSPLKAAEGALIINNDYLTIEEVMQKIMNLVHH